jgi:hypothetical protein
VRVLSDFRHADSASKTRPSARWVALTDTPSICASIHPEPFHENNHDAVKNHAIKSLRAIKAADMTSRLNLRIRLSYACAQLISRTLTGVRLVVSINSILICEVSARLNQLLPYFSQRVSVAFRYWSMGSTSLHIKMPPGLHPARLGRRCQKIRFGAEVSLTNRPFPASV